MDKKGIVVVVILLVVALFSFSFLSPVVDYHSSVQQNEPTQGTVLSTGIDERSTDDGQQYRPVITYRYTVGGAVHSGERLSRAVHPLARQSVRDGLDHEPVRRGERLDDRR
jgi:hypothetical protein